ncbi:MAG: YheT family hydrolase [Candidatus Binataceae bacterium]
MFRAPDLSLYPAERLSLPVEGDVVLGVLNRQPGPSPLVVLIHGLTGGEDSRNIVTSAGFYLRRGHNVLRLNLRGAGPSLAASRSQYHSGRSEDVRAAIAALPASLKHNGVLIVGVSLGGNVVLKYLAEGADHAVRAGASVCAPIDLKAAQQRIMAPRNALYHRHLLRAMKQGIRDAHPAVRDRYAPLLDGITSVYEYDDRIVADAHGFTGAEDYYARSSAGPLLGRISVPTLLVHAHNDPWVPAESYLGREWRQDGPLTLALAPDGGHVGFHARDDAQPWHDRVIAAFFADVAA